MFSAGDSSSISGKITASVIKKYAILKIINTAKKLQSIKNVPVYGAIGGFHLFRADDETIINTANWFKDNGLTKFMGGHCTGIHAANEIASIIGIKRDDLSHTAVGSILTKDLNIIRSSVE